MKKAYVATSGGVDSSVALALLRDEGYDVMGVYFKTYKPDGNRDYCRQQGMDAQKVCKQLGVPFKVFDLQEEYKEKVFEYMIGEYRAGRTPNPDIMCNKEIKFGIFAQKAFDDGADYIATGHYARVAGSLLLQAKDTNKDQTYFLSQVSQDVLARTLFPIGEFKKSKIRELAEQYGLHTAQKKDSQGICFIGQEIDVKSFLKRYIPEEKGDVLNMNGDIIGSHEGAKLLTIGERGNMTIFPQYQKPNMPRLFVIKRDISQNTVTIGTREELDAEEAKSISSVHITKHNWIGEKPKENTEYLCRIRHRGKLYRCEIMKNKEADYTVSFIDTPYAPAAGQYLALYNGDKCMGGGVMV